MTDLSRRISPFFKKHEGLYHYLEEQVKSNCFTAWSFATRDFCASSFFADEVAPPLEGNCEWLASMHPYFDLSSLSKPLFGNGILRYLLRDNLEFIGKPLIEIFSPGRSPVSTLFYEHLKACDSKLTLLDVLSHRSGLPPWTWFGKGLWQFKHGGKSEDIAQILLEKNEAGIDTGECEATLCAGIAKHLHQTPASTCYSDLNYYLLAKAIEEMWVGDSKNIPTSRDSTLNHWRDLLQDYNASLGANFFHASLSPSKTARAIPYFPYISLQDTYMPDTLATAAAFGAVHDTNANICASVGVVSAHAGLFGTAHDVANALPFLEESQRKLKSIFSINPEERFSFGLDTPSGENSTAAPCSWPLPVGENLYGHLGFSGTSFWFREINNALADYNVLLTNRTANRTVIGAARVPRLLIISTSSGASECEAYLQRPNKEFLPLSQNDAEEMIIAHSRSCVKYWDKNCIKPYPNINSIRREIAKRTWERH